MAPNRIQEYADALDEVERRRKSGQLTEGEALVWKQRLLREVDTPTFSRIGNRLLMAVVVLLVILAMLSFIF